MERSDWIKQMQSKLEHLYDLGSPRYWTEFGLYPNETQIEYLQMFLERVPARSKVLSAGCGAGRYDGIVMEAGHSVTGIDLSEGMLTRARQVFPKIRYEKLAMQDMDFQNEFDGIICLDAMEHVFPEDWPGIMRRFQLALKPDGLLFFTIERVGDHAKESYERARALGLPVVSGEIADQVDEAYERAVAADGKGDAEDVAAYHYLPSTKQVQTWITQAGLVIEIEEGEFRHPTRPFIVRKLQQS
ncbi:MAG: methyltransferase domain-containing protein [Dehalococcoidales bacterium]|nr:MAG: methyltransferase domain-containing protein [Dehalococcoidales bacterium]